MALPWSFSRANTPFHSRQRETTLAPCLRAIGTLVQKARVQRANPGRTYLSLHPLVRIASKFHHHCRVETEAGFMGIAALVCQNAGRADPIIYIVMGVPVDPQRNSAFCNQGIEIREKGWAKRAGCMLRRLRASAGRMMSN